ncbi:hypothetical protein [Zooshikella harenae]|uniref:Uncharacterized protein n=1 Tax=Zooshikella harenae TaxID=2827238 RepID=A0ABS5ZFI0_9GAMM|nr:hypothetical protein [Zooshikella harenae]MBU2712036.1 hypothetical protein [Zooshikella harenae]
MGVIAKDMTKLKHDIAVQRQQRQEILKKIRNQSLELSAQVNRSMQQIKDQRLSKSGREARDRLQYVTTLASDVSRMLRYFQQQRVDSSRARATDRAEYLTNMREGIHQQLNHFRQFRLNEEEKRHQSSVYKDKPVQHKASVSPQENITKDYIAEQLKQEVTEARDQLQDELATTKSILTGVADNVRNTLQSTAADVNATPAESTRRTQSSTSRNKKNNKPETE